MEDWTTSLEDESTFIIIALYVRINRKWEIGIFPPHHPFSPGMIISDKIFGGCPNPASLLIQILGLVEHNQLQKKDLQYNQFQFKEAAGRVWIRFRDELNTILKTTHQIFLDVEKKLQIFVNFRFHFNIVPGPSQKIIMVFLGPRGPLRTPSFVRSPVRPSAPKI